jgi:hypothetical protein
MRQSFLAAAWERILEIRFTDVDEETAHHPWRPSSQSSLNPQRTTKGASSNEGPPCVCSGLSELPLNAEHLTFLLLLRPAEGLCMPAAGGNTDLSVSNYTYRWVGVNSIEGLFSIS